MAGDLMLVQEGTPSGSGLTRLYFDGNALKTQAITLAPGSVTANNWESIVVAPIGIGPIPPPSGAMDSLTGYVYDDLNNDGLKQSGEPGVENVTVALSGTTAQGKTVSMTTSTWADGSYHFD